VRVRAPFLASLINIVPLRKNTRGLRQIFSLFFLKFFFVLPLDLWLTGDYISRVGNKEERQDERL